MDRPATAQRRHAPPGATPSAIERREAGMDLVHRVNRWLIAAAVSAAGFLSLAAAHAFHGHTVTSGGAASSASSAAQQSQASSSAGASGLSSPAQAPAPAAPAPSAVVSGGS
jgi:hypothetical protein